MSNTFSINCSKAIANNYATRPGSKIEVIKSIRTITGCGLKEAKDISELTGYQTLTLTARHNISSTMSDDEYYEDHFRILRNNDVEVGSGVHRLLKDLRELGSQALLVGEDELANEILQLVLAEKLRRK